MHGDSDRLLIYHGQSLLVSGDRLTWHYRDVESLVVSSRPAILVGVSNDVRYLAVDLEPAAILPADAELVSLRQILVEGRTDDFRLPGLGNQLTSWYRSHRYCGVCGAETAPDPRERAMLCPNCEFRWYPRINPCVIVLVVDGERLLLARHTRYRINMYSCLAGFIEAGETPEQTVHREIREEAGIEVRNIRYIRSQSWPFPSQLMLGFHADYASGELRPDEEEIDDIQWFSPHDMPRHPSSHISVAGYLIDAFVNRQQKRD